MNEAQAPIEQLVSVIVPAYNASAWLDETLTSVAGQTHRELEVIVVDDGSRDDTALIAERFAQKDPRFRVVRQKNAGVAAARNHGASLASADLLAFVDADDLWASDKIERQLAALEAAGPEAGLCYSWYVLIDADSRVTASWDQPVNRGNVQDALFLENFVGNGSAALVRRRAFEDAGGYEPALHAAGAQGCEDYLFYCRVAARHGFAVVPDHLVGYRELPGNMSSDLTRMLRSWMMVVDEMRLHHPEKRALIHEGLRRYARWLTRRAVHARRPRMLARLLRELARREPWLAIRMGLLEAPRALIDMGLAWHRRRAPLAAPPPAPERRGRFVAGRRYSDI